MLSPGQKNVAAESPPLQYPMNYLLLCCCSFLQLDSWLYFANPTRLVHALHGVQHAVHHIIVCSGHVCWQAWSPRNFTWPSCHLSLRFSFKWDVIILYVGFNICRNGIGDCGVIFQHIVYPSTCVFRGRSILKVQFFITTLPMFAGTWISSFGCSSINFCIVQLFKLPSSQRFEGIKKQLRFREQSAFTTINLILRIRE